MDLQSNLEYLCRVCAANTKGKGNSVAECAYILKTPGLKDKLDKFLYLKVVDNDSLPKVLCKTCFRQVEATASLSKIAKHTQQVFRDFLLSNLPKSSSKPMNTSEVISSDFLGNKDSEKSQNERPVPPAPVNSAVHMPPPQSLPPPPPPVPQPKAYMIAPPSPRRTDDVIVNVSVSDPLTRDNQLKMISSSQRRQSLLIESRYTPKSIAQKPMAAPLPPPPPPPLPTTTAAAATERAKIPKSLTVESLPAAPTTNNSKLSYGPVLNFYPHNKPQQQQSLLQHQQQQQQQQHQQQQQQQPQQQQQRQEKPQQQSLLLPLSQPKPQSTPPAQVTTFSSGGYVIGRLNTGSAEKEEPKKTTLPLADNVLQQKRKNLVKALNNIKANNLGQVSLLKSSQQKQPSSIAPQNVAPKTPLAEVVNQAAEDELPEKIIIAAPKNKSPEKFRKEPLNLSSKLGTTNPTPAPTQKSTPSQTTTTSSQAPSPSQTPTSSQTPTPSQTPAPPTPPQPTVTTTVITQEPAAAYNPPPPAPKPTFPEDILLGRVIRDMDLLKLILKALQWPVDKNNIESQLQRLKNSKFTDIMSDSNLLQDTDLTQLLGPYLAPVLLAAHALQLQQHQLLKNTTLNQNMSAAYITQKSAANLDTQAEINKSIPYKLPPETSVQLVPATPEEQEQTSKSPPLAMASSSSSSSTSLKRNKKHKEPNITPAPPKRQRRAAAQKARESIVILSDEEDDLPLKRPATKQRRKKVDIETTANIPIELNSHFMTQLGMLNGSGGDEANEALLALLNRQKDAIAKQQNKTSRRRRNSISNMITLPASEFDALIDLDDDIVLMEPVTTTSSAISSSESLTASSVVQQLQQPLADLNSFIMPQVPLITRPIIKRRKTVIQTSRPSFDLSMDLAAKQSTFLAKEKQTDQQQATQAPPQTFNLPLQLPSNTGNLERISAATNSTSTSLLTKPMLSASASSLLPTKSSTTTTGTQQKKLQNKATLGQQLLEAIGLQKIPSKFNVATNIQAEFGASSSSGNIDTIKAALPLATNKQSIKQIRSALKKSLKQAQEQQQQRKRELSSSNISTTTTTTIIQDADSTTKSNLKEIVVVEGKGNKSDNCSSSLVDVEDQIDKVTLMVRGKNDKGKPHETLAAAAPVMATEKEVKTEAKKLLQSKIPNRRRTVPVSAAAAANRGVHSVVDSKLDNPSNVIEIISDTKIVDTENKKSEKDDNESINKGSSSATTLPISFADSMTSSIEINQSKEEEVVAPTPKKRGRKRKEIEKEETSETAATQNEENDEKTLTINDKLKDEEAASEDHPGNDKTEEEKETLGNKNSSGRPTRQSKTLSKYYKGPDRATPTRRSLPSRSTRNSNIGCIHYLCLIVGCYGGGIALLFLLHKLFWQHDGPYNRPDVQCKYQALIQKDSCCNRPR